MKIRDVFIAPSINSLFFTGILLLTIFIIFIRNFNKIRNLNYYQQLILLSTITIAIGMHGLIHLGTETNYGFNPYNWF
jgi:hypothetical protein